MPELAAAGAHNIVAPMAEQLYSAEEAAQILGLQVRTVRNYLREGRLPGVRIGKQYRIARADLEAFTAGFTTRDDVERPPDAQPPKAAGVPPSAEVSSVVQLEGAGAVLVERLERTLAAATLAAAGQITGELRVEPIYDADRQRLKLVMVGPLAEVADLLRIVDALTRGPGSPGVSAGTSAQPS